MKAIARLASAIIFFLSIQPLHSMDRMATLGKSAAQTQVSGPCLFWHRAAEPRKSKTHKITLVIKTVDGSIELKKSTARKLKTIKLLTEDCYKDSYIEVNLQDLFDNPPSISSLRLLLQLIENSLMNREPLSGAQLKEVFDAANYLEAPRRIRYYLAEMLMHIFSTEKNPSILNNLPPSIKKAALLQRIGYKVPAWLQTCLAATERVDIDLSNNNLESLDGLELLASKKTRTLDISNNRLDKLDLKKIKKAFPGIQHINAQNNCIEKLFKHDIEALSEGLELQLDNNPISHCEPSTFFKTPERVSISLRSNPRLTSTALHNLSTSLQPSAYQKRLVGLFRSLMPITNAADIDLWANHPFYGLAFMSSLLILTGYMWSKGWFYSIVSQFDHAPKSVDFNNFSYFYFGCFALGLGLPFQISLINRIVLIQANKQFWPCTIELDPRVSYLALKIKERKFACAAEAIIPHPSLNDID
jgi:hypothetical protein